VFRAGGEDVDGERVDGKMGRGGDKKKRSDRGQSRGKATEQKKTELSPRKEKEHYRSVQGNKKGGPCEDKEEYARKSTPARSLPQ